MIMKKFDKSLVLNRVRWGDLFICADTNFILKVRNIKDVFVRNTIQTELRCDEDQLILFTYNETTGEQIAYKNGVDGLMSFWYSRGERLSVPPLTSYEPSDELMLDTYLKLGWETHSLGIELYDGIYNIVTDGVSFYSNEMDGDILVVDAVVLFGEMKDK